jgi:hypothetical protein
MLFALLNTICGFKTCNLLVPMLVSDSLTALLNNKLNSVGGIKPFCHTTSYQSLPQNEVELVSMIFDHVLGLSQMIS